MSLLLGDKEDMGEEWTQRWLAAARLREKAKANANRNRLAWQRRLMAYLSVVAFRHDEPA